MQNVYWTKFQEIQGMTIEQKKTTKTKKHKIKEHFYCCPSSNILRLISETH